MKYHIGLVSRLLDLSPEGLRLYEREGILEPHRDEGSGYRYYERLDITSLMRARSYQKYGFPLHKVGELLNTDNMDFITSNYIKKEDELMDEIHLKEMELKRLKDTRLLIERFPEVLWKIHKEMRPAMYRFEFMHKDKLLIPSSKYSAFRRWMALTPFAFSSQRHSWKAMMDGYDDSFSAIALLEEDKNALHAEDIVSIGAFLPPCPSLSTIIEVKGDNSSCAHYLRFLKEYAEENGIEIAGDPVSQSIVSMNKKDNYSRYRKVWLPISERI